MNRCTIRALGLALLFASGSAAVSAQALPQEPRVELGGGASVAVGFDNESYGAVPFVNGYAGWRLSRRIGIEGYLHLWPSFGADDFGGIYRAQVAFRPDRGKGHTYIGLGLAGAFDWNTWPEYRWTDSEGRVFVEPAGRHFEVTPPVLPVVSIGYERNLSPRLRVRAELAASVVPDDEFMAILMPSLTVTIPIGRRTAR
jgi:hypothetical protein